MIDIDILCAAGPNSFVGFKFLIWTVASLTSSNANIHWKAVLCGTKKVPKGVEVLDVITAKKKRSVNHGKAINRGIEHLKSPYTVVCDTDTAVLLMDWDNFLIDKINSDPDVALIGCAYPTWRNRYQNFPTAIFSMFDTKILQSIDIDFTPVLSKKTGNIKSERLSKSDAKIYETPSIKHDTGCRLPLLYKKNGYKGIPIKAIECRNKLRKLKGRCGRINALHEYHLEEKAVVAHLGNSSGKGIKFFNGWSNSISEYIKSTYGIKNAHT